MKKLAACFLMLTLVANAFAAIRTETIEYKEGDTTLEGLLAYDEARTGRRPGVLVVHQWKGLGGYEKRRAHFSSLILTGQMTRDAAIERVGRPELDAETVAHEVEYLAKKLDLSADELQAIFAGPNRTYRDYRNKYWIISAGTRVLQSLGLENRRFK